MYAVKFWKHIGIAESYAIIDDADRKRYIAFFQSDKSELKYWIKGYQVQSSDLLQALLMADKVNQKQVALITRYAGPQNNIFPGLVPDDFRISHTSSRKKVRYSNSTSTEAGFTQYKLCRLEVSELSEGDVLYNVFLLCKNPFEPGEPFGWVMSFKSTVHIDRCGNRYAYINDDTSRYRSYAFAESKDDCINAYSKFRIGYRNRGIMQVSQPKPISYKGADMGEG